MGASKGDFKLVLKKYCRKLSKEELQDLIYDLMTDEMERILLAIELTNSIDEAATVLDTSRRTIYRRLKD